MAFYWAHTCTFKNRFSVEQRGHKESLDFGVLSNQKGVAKATTLGFFKHMDGYTTKGQSSIFEALIFWCIYN